MNKKFLLASCLSLIMSFSNSSLAADISQEPAVTIILPNPSIYICTDEDYMKKLSDHIAKVEAHNETQLTAITNFVKECKLLLEEQAK